MCRLAKFADISTHEIEEKVLEKANSIFFRMVGLSGPTPASIPAITIKAATQLAILSLNIEKAVERLLAPKITLDQLENAVPLSLQHELKVILRPLAPEGTLPW